MSGPPAITLAAFAALAAAGSFGVAAALQHRQAQSAPRAGAISFRLLAHLARRPLWLAEIALAAAAYGLQALALAFGPYSRMTRVRVLEYRELPGDKAHSHWYPDSVMYTLSEFRGRIFALHIASICPAGRLQPWVMP
jgi:hypothetical protein